MTSDQWAKLTPMKRRVKTDELFGQRYDDNRNPTPSGNSLTFFVEGTPATKGSWTHVGYGKMRPASNRTWSWEETIAWQAREKYKGPVLKDCPVYVALSFYLPRPKSVTRDWPCVAPDLDKLVRAVFDAMQNIVYQKDGQVCATYMMKQYQDSPINKLSLWGLRGKCGVHITVDTFGDEPLVKRRGRPRKR